MILGPIPSYVRRASHQLSKKGFESFLVGGAVRDLILKRKPKDWDLATNATPDQVQRIFPNSIPTGKAFGTITVVFKPHMLQVTTYREEGRYVKRRKPSRVSFETKLEKDLERRDFTVNAMAYDVRNQKLIDPFGGRKDLKRRVLRTVGDSKKRFSEDALRMIRAGRFISSLNLKPVLQMSKAAKRCSKWIPELSKERIHDELVKLLMADKPSVGFSWFESCGILKRFLPELSNCKKIFQGGWHSYDVFKHTLATVDLSPLDLKLRLALLLHDIAKPMTRTRDAKGFHFYQHDKLGAKMALKVLKRLRFSNEMQRDIPHLILHHLFDSNAAITSEASVRRFIQRIGKEHLETLFELRKADAKGCGPRRKPSKSLDQLKKKVNRTLRQKPALTVKDLKVNGHDVMKWLGKSPGPEIGKILHLLLAEVVQNPSLNQVQELKKRAVQYGL